MSTSNKDQLVQMLQNAVRVELATIPLYLFAQFSVKTVDDSDVPVIQTISQIVSQEMLHLSLSGNILTAIDAGPKLYTATGPQAYLPTYGGENDTILSTDIRLQLRPCHGESLVSFIEIEKPYKHTNSSFTQVSRPTDGGDIPTYQSIGTFYEAIENLLQDPPPFPNQAQQFTSTEWPEFNTNLQINSGASALAAITIIIDQGEGPESGFADHYDEFKNLLLTWIGSAQAPWTCWPVVTNPKTSMYDPKEFPFIFTLSRAFDALYCFLLATIEKSWETTDATARATHIDNMKTIMFYVVGALAGVLVQQPWKEVNFGKNAAPTFSRYDVGPCDVDEALVLLLNAGKYHLREAIVISPPQFKKILQDVLNRLPST